MADHTGEKRGHLTIIKQLPTPEKDSHSWWLCRCDCGRYEKKRYDNLSNHSYCGNSACIHNRKKTLSLTGNRFGHLVVIKRLDKRYFCEYYWLCRCDCGNTCERYQSQLRNSVPGSRVLWCDHADCIYELRYLQDRASKKEEQRKRYNKKARETNKEYRNKKIRLRYATDSQFKNNIRNAERRWRQRNKEKRRQIYINRRARECNAVGRIRTKDIKMLLNTQGSRCKYCNCKVNDYHVDHVIPLSRGGTNLPENLVITCPRCNLQKHTKTPEEWIDRWYEQEDT